MNCNEYRLDDADKTSSSPWLETYIELQNVQRLIKDTFSIIQSRVTMGLDGIANYMKDMDNLKKRERTLKIKYARERHIRQDGNPRAIYKDRGLIATKLADGRKISAISEDDLYLKLFDEVYDPALSHVVDDTIEPTFGEVYEEMISKKKEIAKETNNASAINTCERNDDDYKRFITPELSTKKISDIDEDFIYLYSENMLLSIMKNTGKSVTSKAFNENYVGILKSVFSFAKKHKYVKHNIMAEIDELNSRNPEYKILLNCQKKSAKKKAFQPKQIDAIEEEMDKRINSNDKQYGPIYNAGYMFKVAKHTGVRIAELCALKKEDIDYSALRIHVHAQQIENRETGELIYKSLSKNENMCDEQLEDEGRYVPITKELKIILNELEEKQAKFGIKTEWVFAHTDGSWIRAETEYMQVLRRVCLKISKQMSDTMPTNNHAIRMYYNSYVLAPAGVDPADRAAYLGHSVDVNTKYYTFENADYCDKTREMLDNFNDQNKSK